jgi:clan AA aspartic protease (TIGR02281 family)
MNNPTMRARLAVVMMLVLAVPIAAEAQVGPTYEVALKEEGGTFVVPVQINGAITLDFTVDSGAADVQIPLDVFRTLVRAGTIAASDYIGEQTYTLADGSTQKQPRFIVRELKVGGYVLRNVPASVSPVDGNLLLGESFLSRFAQWTLDNEQHVLKLVEKSTEPVSQTPSPSLPSSVATTAVPAAPHQSATGGGRFQVTACNSILDTATHLEWYLGPDANITWPDADTWINGLRVCNKSWTMPSIDQLKTLFDRNAVAGIGYFTRGRYWPAHISPIFSGIGKGSWVWAQGSHHGDDAPAFNFNQNVKVEIPSTDFYGTVRVFAVRPD